MTTCTNPTRKAKTKAATVDRMLRRDKGATLAEIEKATGWKPHSCRAFLSGVRKTGSTVTQDDRAEVYTAHRVTAEADQ